MTRTISRILPSVSVLAFLIAAPAYAQDAEQTGEDVGEEIVVTGTSIRGVAPAGSQTVGLNGEEITATNATSSTELLTTLPQLGGFNALPSAGGSGSAGVTQSVNSPLVRGLGSSLGGTIPTASPTLILMDGHRLVSAGVLQTIVDPDVVPPGALANVEVVTDGGSAIYGADAIGGVINFITRRDIDRPEFNIRQGFGDDYQSTDAYFTLAHAWETGSAYLTYNYSQHDAIYGRDRDYARAISYDATDPGTFGLPLGRSCNPGSVDVGGNSYAIVNGVPQTTPATAAEVRCDQNDDTSIYPQERRDSALFAFNQDLNDVLNFDLRAWYTRRVTKSDVGATFSSPGGAQLTQIITAANNAHFIPITGAQGEAQTVHYDFSAVPGINTIQRLTLETFGFVPQFTMDLGHDWQARAFLNYGRSITTAFDPEVDPTVIADNAFDINFYDLGATDPAIWRDLQASGFDQGRGEAEMVNARAIFDGPLFSLPAGEIRGAAGIEYLGESFENERTTSLPVSATRRSHSVFGELNVPLVSPENNVPLINELTVTLAARHDTYSDFGSVTVPQYGFTYAPLEWLQFRGKWGQSFQAPSLIDVAKAEQADITFVVPVTLLGRFLPTDWVNVDPQHAEVTVEGGGELNPMRADTFQIGVDISPPIVPDLTLGLTYWNIDYNDLITTPNVVSPNFYDPAFTEFAGVRIFDGGNVLLPADIQNFILARGVSLDRLNERLAQAGYDITDVNLVIDNSARNIAGRRLAGWDGYVRYTHGTSFGSIYLNLNASYSATSKTNTDGFAWRANSADDQTSPRWDASLTVGATIGDDWRAQANLRYTPNYDETPTDANGQQGRIDSFHPLNLFTQYDGFGDDLSVSLGVNNVFDDDPPHVNGVGFTQAGYAGGNLGRVVYFGLNKRF